MAKPTTALLHSLTTYYKQVHEKVVGSSPSLNRNTAKWGWEAMLMDYSVEQVKELVDYYIEHFAERPTLQWFLNNYEKVDDAMREYLHRKDVVDAQRAVTAQRYAQWKERQAQWQKKKS
jgi:hypothetical protein